MDIVPSVLGAIGIKVGGFPPPSLYALAGVPIYPSGN